MSTTIDGDQVALTTADRWRHTVERGVLARAADVMGSDADASRMARCVLLEAAKPAAYPGAPTLRDCDPVSVVRVVMDAAALRLYPGPLQHCHIMPRRSKGGTEAQLMLGYRGLLELARRSDQIAAITAEVVYRDEVTQGLWTATHEPPEVHHRVSLGDIDRSDGALVAAYCVVRLTSGARVQRILTRADIDARRVKAGKGGTSPYSPWSTSFAAMARKSAIRALLTSGLVPMSEGTVAAIREDAAREYEPPERREVPASIVDVVTAEPEVIDTEEAP